MQKSLKRNVRWIAIQAITWSLSKQLFLAIQLWGAGRSNAAQLSAGLLFGIIALTGLLDGLVFGWVDAILDRFLKKMRFIERLLINVCMNLSLGLLLTTLLMPVLLGEQEIKRIVVFSELFVTSNVLIVAVYMMLVTFLLRFANVAVAWIQVHDFRQLMSAKEQSEEERIFMFLDMKSSTAHAENLGASRYSMLIRDCFSDMSEAAGRNKAELYQYVGDEVVFTWRTSSENAERSIQLYFEFTRMLRERSSYYLRSYGITPEFKAGIHQGVVIRTCVNSIRKATAYHGDVINTAARIQSKCNELGSALLVSSSLTFALPDRFRKQWRGSFQLRGKQEPIELFTIKESESQFPVQAVTTGRQTFRLWLNVF